MPEAPQMQALAERVGEWLVGAVFEGYDPLGFTGLKTSTRRPRRSSAPRSVRVDRRAKYVTLHFDNDLRIVFHLSQAGRLDFEQPPKKTQPKGSVVRWRFSDDRAVLLREFGTERKAGWWVLAPDDVGPFEKLGPEATSDEFAAWFRDGRRRSSHPHDPARPAHGRRRRARLRRRHPAPGQAVAVRVVEVAEARRARAVARRAAGSAGRRARARAAARPAGCRQNKLGEHFTVHGKAGLPCPVCGTDLKRVSYESHEVVYCPTCQTGGKVLADRRLSRLVK